MDFGFGNADNETGGQGSASAQSTIVEKPEDVKVDENGNPIADINDNNGGNGNNDKPDGNGGQTPPNNDNEGNGDHNKNSKDDDEGGNTELTAGTTIDIDGKQYTVAENGDIVDSEGNVFKEAKDVQDWLKEVNLEDSNNTSLDLAKIQELVGINITGEDDKPVEYENTNEGISKYIADVIESAKQDNYDVAINSLFTKYPIIEDVLNYYLANGNSLDGYGEIKDRSSIVLDKDNTEQQEYIIKTAWKEQGRKGNVDAYIDYLKSSGTLFDIAEEELQGLKDKDAEEKSAREEQAKKAQEDAEAASLQYWTGVKEVIKGRKIAGYEIPEQIVVNRDGKKISVTPDDFFKYLYLVDKNGESAYVKDLKAQTQESRRDDEILRAYLMFTGGNYSNLVQMAINEEKVKQLRVASKSNKKPKVTITKPTSNNSNSENNFGY